MKLFSNEEYRLTEELSGDELKILTTALKENRIQIWMPAAGLEGGQWERPKGFTANALLLNRAYREVLPLVKTTPGIEAVLHERLRQINCEGRTLQRDREYLPGTLASAAMAYLRAATDKAGDTRVSAATFWPWDKEGFKPTTRRRNLEKAAALIIAELDAMGAEEE